MTLPNNAKKVLVIFYAVLLFADRLQQGEHTWQWVYSSVARASIVNCTSRSSVTRELLRILPHLLEDLNIFMAASRLPSVLNLLADRFKPGSAGLRLANHYSRHTDDFGTAAWAADASFRCSSHCPGKQLHLPPQRSAHHRVRFDCTMATRGPSHSTAASLAIYSAR